MNSTQKTVEYDVLIVGCGPVGAAFANLLRMYGHKVAIFDRDKEIFHAPRAMGFDEETMRLLQNLGVMQRMAETGDFFQSHHHFLDGKGRVLLSFDEDTLGPLFQDKPAGYPSLNMVHQPHVEKYLRDDFSLGQGVDTFLGYEVLSVSDDAEKATLIARNLDDGSECEFQGSYLIGSDGGRSLVRRALGVKRVDLGFSEEWLVVDAVTSDKALHQAIPNRSVFICDKGSASVLAKGSHGHVRFDALRFDSDEESSGADPRDYMEDARQIISQSFDVNKFEIIRSAPYTFYAGMPEKWRNGRIFVAGDAAHQTPPFAGQGLNMGMRDVANLTFKLHLALSDKASDSVLDTYDLERRPASVQTIQGAVMNGNLVHAKSPIKVWIRKGAFFLGRHFRWVASLFWTLGTRKPAYREGLIGSASGTAGSPMIQPLVRCGDGDEVLLDEMLGLDFALILKNSASGESIERFVDELNGRVLVLAVDFEDIEGKIAGWFKKNGASAVLLRPDRYVFDASNDGNALCAELLEALAV